MFFLISSVLGKVVLVKTYEGESDLGSSWRSVFSVTSRPLYPGERTCGTHWIGGWLDHRVGADDMEK
jgi:hypothetical protein